MNNRIRYKIFQILLIMFLFFVNIFAQFPKQIENDMKFGLEYFTNYEFNEAKIIFSQIIQENPKDPISRLFFMITEYEHMKINGNYKYANNYLLKESKNISLLFENKMEQYPQNVTYIVYYAMLKGMDLKATVSSGNNYLKVFKESWQTSKLIEKANKINNNNYDLYGVLGGYNFYIGVLCNHNNLLGIFINSENKMKEGIKHFTSAYKNGTGFKWLAGESLVFIYLHDKYNYKKAYKIGKHLSNRFPNNLEFKSLYIESLIYMNKIDSAEILLKNYSDFYKDFHSPKKEMWNIREKYLQATLNMKKENYKKAIEEFLSIINMNNIEYKWIKTTSYFKIGQIFDINNDRKNAKKYYNLTIDTNEKMQAVLDAKKYLKTPFIINNK